MMTESEHPQPIERDGVRLRPLRTTDAQALYDYLSNPLVTERTSFPVITMPMVEGMIVRVKKAMGRGATFQVGNRAGGR